MVEYSDSEGSETDLAQSSASAASGTPSNATVKAKTATSKVVERSESGKIRVALPEVKSESSDGPADTLEPPAAKRPRTGGAFSGLASLLPPPKNTGKKSAPGASTGLPSGTTKSDRPKSMGTGVSLRTGAAPAFSRGGDQTVQARPASTEISSDTRGGKDDDAENRESALVRDKLEPEEPKLVGKPLMFKPLSVSRKPQGKKKRPPAHATTANDKSTHTSATSVTSRPETSKAKVSLFGNASEEVVGNGTGASEREYQPLMDNEDQDEVAVLDDALTNTDNAPSSRPKSPPASTNELKAVADSLNLTASERRQLFGRKGQPSDAQIAQFSLAEEYQHNNKMRDDDSSAPQLNPVKSIAPGKHSLQQLVNAATGQKDALEEAFAQGRKNKRDAGTRYGWA